MSILHRALRCALATIAFAALGTPLREATAQAPAAPLRAMEPASDVVHAAPAAPRKKREPASFNGIQPGTATLADVNEAWGRPLKVARRGSASEQVYQVEPFARVEVTFEKDRVVSIVIQLKQALETKEHATQ